MDNQDLTLERRLQGKDETIAELLEALEDVLADAEAWYHAEVQGTKNYDPNTYGECHELIRKHKGEVK